MARGIWEKIEWVRDQPEHVRTRYVAGCLAVSMAFIIGIWILSVKENFQRVKRVSPAVIESGKGLIPAGKTPSLGDLAKQGKVLQAEGQDVKTGYEYFEQQFRGRSETAAEGDTAVQSAPGMETDGTLPTKEEISE